MNDLNNVTLSGRLTRDSELKYLPSGTAVVNFGLAVGRAYRKGEEWLEDTCFIDAAWFGAGAERYAPVLQKGVECVIDGALKMDSWEVEGQKRSRLTVRVNRLWIPHSYLKNSQSQVEQDDDVPFAVT